MFEHRVLFVSRDLYLSLRAIVHINVLTSMQNCDMIPYQNWRIIKMGRNPTGERNYQIEKMWNVHHEITRMLLMGMKSVDIARQLNVSEVMVSYTKNSALVQRKLDIMQGARDMDAVSISKRIQELAPKAVDVLDRLLESEVESIAFKSAVDVLDRAGHGAVKKEMTLTGHLTSNDIEDIKSRAREIGLCRQPVLEIEAA
jgi:hypothetical protein